MLFYLDSTNTKIIFDPTFGTVDYVTVDVQLGYLTKSFDTSLPILSSNQSFPDRTGCCETICISRSDSDTSNIEVFVDTNILSQ